MADDQSSPDKSKQFNDRLTYLEMVARDTAARLYEIEKHLGLVFHAVPREVKPSPAMKPETQRPQSSNVSEPIVTKEPSDKAVAQPESDQSRRPVAATLPERPGPETAVPRIAHTSAGAQAPRAAQTRTAARSMKGADLESRIGGNWFNRIGVLAIFLGVAFFLKYAVDNEWIGPTTRVLIGVAIGILFLIGGERLRKRYASYAYGLTGGGIAILYASIWFASSKRYGLISTTGAFAFMVVVTVTASLLAARYSALPIAVLGLIGGFLTPILLSTGVDNETGLFGYIAVLDAGVLLLAYSKQWRSLNYLSFIATILMFAAWMEKWYDPSKLRTTIIFLSLFFIIFALLAVLYNVVNRRPTGWLDLAMVFSNALLYFGTSYALLDDKYQSRLGLFAVLVAAFYLGLGYFTYRRDREDKLLVFTFLGLGFLFSVLAVPIQFEQHWITMGWAIEGAVMTWIGLRAEDRTSRYASLVVFGIALGHWFNTDVREFAYHANETFLPLLNRRALSCAVLVGALAASAVFYKRMKSNVEDRERSMFSALYLLVANSLAVILLSLDAIDYFEQAKARASGHDSQASVGNTKALTLTALWAFYGAGTLFVGITRRLKPLRYLALILLGGAVIKVLLVDLNYYAESWHSLILNQTFLSLAAIVAALALSARFYARGMEPDDDERQSILPLLIGAANLLAVAAFAAEALGHFDRAQAISSGETVVQLENAKQLALTAVWAVYGAVGLIIGIRRSSLAVRAGSLILLLMATVKALAVDLAYYKAGWHTLFINPTFAALALLIVVFAAGAWFYSRAEGIADKERSTVIRALAGLANVLAVIALSAEVIGFFDRAQAVAQTEAFLRLENTKQLALSAVWTIYGAAGLIVGIRRRSKDLRQGSLILLAVAAVKVVIIDLRFYGAGWHTLLVNPTFEAFALLIVALVVGAWLYSRATDIDEKERRAVIPALIGAANLLAIVGLSAEAIGYFDRARMHAQFSTEVARFDNNEQFVLSALWTVFGAGMLIGGIKRGSKPFRWAGLLLLAIVMFKIGVADVNYYRAPWHMLIFNETFAAFALLIAALGSSVWFYSRAEDIDEERSSLVPFIVGLVNVLAIIALSTEVLGYFGKNLRASGLSEDTIRNLRFARQLWLSLVWAIYSGVMLTVGIARRSKLLRVMALLLLGLTILKVFLLDLSSLEKLYRIISFIVLGAILLAVSFLYQRYRQRMVEFISDPTEEAPVSSESN